MDSNNFDTNIPVYHSIPEKWEEARQFLVEHLKKISNAVNLREVGYFIDDEVISGKLFIPTAAMLNSNSSTTERFRTVLRKVIDFGPLPNNSTKAVPHGINFDVNFTLLSLWAAATDPVNFLAFQIPFVADPTTNSILLRMDSTNVYITTHDDKTQYTRVFVIIEYMQEI